MKTYIVAAIASCAPSVSAADASVTVNVAQVGANVVATTSGSIDLANLSDLGEYYLDSAIVPSIGYVGTGAEYDNVEGYQGISGPASFGPGNDEVFSDSATGDAFAINASSFGDPTVFVPEGYTSNSALASVDTFDNATFASLGLNTGSYVFTQGDQTITVNIGSVAAVPEPVTWAMMIGGFGLVGGMVRRAHRKSEESFTRKVRALATA